MKALRFEFETEMPCSPERLWDFHMRPDALAILSPPGTRVVDRGDGIADGSVIRLQLGWGPLSTQWRALHSSVRPPHSFTDVALTSPFSYWAHQHEMLPSTGGYSRLRDLIHLLPPRWMPRWLARPLLRAALGALFAWRHRRTSQHIRRLSSRTPPVETRLFDGGLL